VSQRPIESLEELFALLGRERSLRGRLRVLSRAWALLRSLSPKDRERVAFRVGSDWAWKRIERAFLADGDLSEKEEIVGRAFRSLGNADPDDLRGMIATIRSGDFDDRKDLLVSTLAQALEEEVAAGEALREDSLEAAARDALAERTSDAESPEESPDAHRDEAPAHAAARPGPVAAPADRQTPAAEPIEATAAQAARWSSPAPVPPPPAFDPPPFGLELRPEPGETLPSPAVIDVDSDFVTHSATERLRLLRRIRTNATWARALGAENRRALVDSLGGGWAARRAIAQWIEDGTLDDADEALALIERLERPGQRLWCLADLARSGALDDSAEERVLMAAPSEAGRRRLTRYIRDARARRAEAAGSVPAAR